MNIQAMRAEVAEEILRRISDAIEDNTVTKEEMDMAFKILSDFSKKASGLEPPDFVDNFIEVYLNKVNELNEIIGGNLGLH